MEKIKVVVVGAGGVIGQHLCISVPPTVEAVFTRLHGGGVYDELDLGGDFEERLDGYKPGVVVNLSGCSSVDWVQENQVESLTANFNNVCKLSGWCERNNVHLIHVSSQAALDPVNEYGRQKLMADEFAQKGQNWTIVRPTFVLGVRPFPGIGRENPVERILAGKETESVDDRLFSVSFAWDVAEFIWQSVKMSPSQEIYHVGNPEPMTRFEVACKLGVTPKLVTSDSLNIAPRPQNTVYKGSWFKTPIPEGMIRLKEEWEQKEGDTVEYKAKEIAAFLHRPWQECLTKLEDGFAILHGEVAEDFKRAALGYDPAALTAWYKNTESYIWELSAYHCHPGFNYTGMCKGIIDKLKSDGKNRVLCLGDGIGTMTIAMKNAGLISSYHDLMGSKTADFAQSRFHMRFKDHTESWLTDSFDPGSMPTGFDAIMSADYLEHVPNVEEWVRAIYNNLVSGGLFFAQNAFNCGSGPEGSIPMHLVCNDRFEHDWDPLLATIGFVRESNNWYRKP